MTMENTENKCWFILAHCFNMDGRAASQTITDRIPYFLEKGISPVVLSAPTGRRDHRFPHYQVFSAFPSGLLFEGRHIISRKFKTKITQKILKSLLTLVLLPFYLLEVLIIHFDSQWSWFISAAVKGCGIVRKHKPGLLYSTAGPPSTHLAAFLLKKIYGLPWLAEIHDPLIYDKEPRKLQYHYFKKWLEGIICRHADAVIYFTDRALECAQQRNNFKCKGHVLRPGAEPPAFSEVQYLKRDTIHFGHFGSLAANRNLKMFFQAIFELVEENPPWQDFICVDIYGAELDS
ncbi:MAG: hypothetical protein KKE17_01540, partial [Proteobacteria bacterium]|nr:hypothetical protein [Pseudomonadota bacterium]MBU1708664.1 hypothetical protein [Pseudomonadota bacterium]